MVNGTGRGGRPETKGLCIPAPSHDMHEARRERHALWTAIRTSSPPTRRVSRPDFRRRPKAAVRKSTRLITRHDCVSRIPPTSCNKKAIEERFGTLAAKAQLLTVT